MKVLGIDGDVNLIMGISLIEDEKLIKFEIVQGLDEVMKLINKENVDLVKVNTVGFWQVIYKKITYEVGTNAIVKCVKINREEEHKGIEKIIKIDLWDLIQNNIQIDYSGKFKIKINTMNYKDVTKIMSLITALSENYY